MSDFEKLINGYRRFHTNYFTAAKDELFAELSQGQSPSTLVIACSDSRVDPAIVMDCKPGARALWTVLPAPEGLLGYSVGGSGGRAYAIVKRALDVIGATLALVVLAPLFAAIAILIRRDSAGPVFFRQLRMGAGGRCFHVFKFRTMHVDAERTLALLLGDDPDREKEYRAFHKLVDDPRVTRVGRFLRRTRLDELPQFVNVLRGDMSIIGPRPERPELMKNLALLIPFFEERMREVKPGITGLAQVSLGYVGELPPDSPLHPFKDDLTNPWKLDGVDGNDADGMRLKLLYDLAYTASLERLDTYLRTELFVLLQTPRVMLRALGR